MRGYALALLSAALFAAPLVRADTIMFTNDYGTGESQFPAYYVGGCYAPTNTCSGVEGYFSFSGISVTSNTIAPITYISDPSGNVSDKIVTSVTVGTCLPPGCPGELIDVSFTYNAGLDMTGTPETCASVGGCAFVYSSGNVQTVGTISYSTGYSTTLQYESLIGTLLTSTLTSFNGGPHTNPVLLPSNEPVGQVTGTIGGDGTEDYYSFAWAGGFFSATASIGGTPNAGASYLFSEGGGSCTSGGSATLNAGDNFTGTISVTDLPAGVYCIGIAANNAADPPYSLTFNTPTAATPEPATVAMVIAGLGIGALRLRRR